MRVPKPYNFHDGVLLMELVVDANGDAAPRLNDVQFTPEEARAHHATLLLEVVRMLCAGIVHGDLSRRDSQGASAQGTKRPAGYELLGTNERDDGRSDGRARLARKQEASRQKQGQVELGKSQGSVYQLPQGTQRLRQVLLLRQGPALFKYVVGAKKPATNRRIATKMDQVRYDAGLLARVIEASDTSVIYRNRKLATENRLLTQEEIDIVSLVLGREYTEAGGSGTVSSRATAASALCSRRSTAGTAKLLQAAARSQSRVVLCRYSRGQGDTGAFGRTGGVTTSGRAGALARVSCADDSQAATSGRLLDSFAALRCGAAG